MTELATHGQWQPAVKSFRSLMCGALRYRYFVPICLTAAFLIRIGWIYVVDAQAVSDFKWYYERGVDFAAGKGYSVGVDAYWPENLPPAALVPGSEFPINGRPTAYWPVGYPAFLGAIFRVTGPSLLAAKVANVVLYLGILFLSYYLAKRMFHSEFTARITLLILAFYPNHIAYSSLLATESLFLFLLLLAVALLTVPKWWFSAASGGVFGLASLVKPQVILLPCLLFVVSLGTNIKRETLRTHVISFVILSVALGLTITPWIIRNYVIFDDFVLISNNGGINLLVGNNPRATGAYGTHHAIASMLGGVQDEHERDVRARALAVEYITEHPWQAVKLWPNKLWYLYRKDVEGISWNERGLGLIESREGRVAILALKVVAQVYYVLILVAFLFSVIVLFAKRRLGTESRPGITPNAVGTQAPTLGLWIVFYFSFVHLLTFSDPRFHFPVMPWIVMYVGALAEVLLLGTGLADRGSGIRASSRP